MRHEHFSRLNYNISMFLDRVPSIGSSIVTVAMAYKCFGFIDKMTTIGKIDEGTRYLALRKAQNQRDSQSVEQSFKKLISLPNLSVRRFQSFEPVFYISTRSRTTSQIVSGTYDLNLLNTGHTNSQVLVGLSKGAIAGVIISVVLVRC